MSHVHVIKMTWGKHVHSCSYSKTTIQAELTYPFIKKSDPVKRVSLWCLPSSTLPLKRDENSVFRCIVEDVFKKSQLLWLEINLYTLFFVYSKSQKRLFSVLCYFVIYNLACTGLCFFQMIFCTTVFSYFVTILLSTLCSMCSWSLLQPNYVPTHKPKLHLQKLKWEKWIISTIHLPGVHEKSFSDLSHNFKII